MNRRPVNHPDPRDPDAAAPETAEPTRALATGRRAAAIDAVVDRLRADLDRLPTAEKALVAGGLYVLDRCARVVERMETLVDEQRAGVRRSREVLELLPPLIGKLGELLDVELADAKARLEERLRKR